MSSHHFVREGQEPALVIADTVPFSLVQDLLEWAPEIYVCEQAIPAFLSWGVKADVFVTTESRVNEWRTTLAHQAPVKILTTSPPDHEVMTALHALLAQRQLSVNIFLRNGDPLLDTLPDLFENMSINVFCDGIKWSRIAVNDFRKWLDVEAQFRIKSKETVLLDGHPAPNDQWINAKTDGFITLQSHGKYWFGEKS